MSGVSTGPALVVMPPAGHHALPAQAARLDRWRRGVVPHALVGETPQTQGSASRGGR
eukprot:CAMPEP_0119141450 /NCGR_PEP_ID=MMETSP1310-20130426/31043_1 /TAXON_ID=464262 /ORGANISM="Genus nov. species nov., Strain RCC2339" /LENGTH=56 /DNA_ID=CAMNT_0007132901 /DNA_START=52 /DNA_END=220 /DNA_ORIENTATION=-